MKSRIIWAAVVLAAMVGFYFATIRPATQKPGPRLDRRKINQEFKAPEIAPPPLPQPVIATPTLAPPVRPGPIVAPRNDPVPGPLEVPIQDGATLDFSTGTPIAKRQGRDQEAMDRALKNMAEATKNTTFPPQKK